VKPATTSASCCAASSATASSAAWCRQAGTITPHTKFEAEVYVLSKDEGGRHTPFFSGYRPQFYFRTTDVTGTATLLGGAEMCMPGDNVKMRSRAAHADQPWTSSCASRSAKAATPSAPAFVTKNPEVSQPAVVPLGGETRPGGTTNQQYRRTPLPLRRMKIQGTFRLPRVHRVRERNYTTHKRAQGHHTKIEKKKYCRFCRQAHLAQGEEALTERRGSRAKRARARSAPTRGPDTMPTRKIKDAASHGGLLVAGVSGDSTAARCRCTAS
jgi:hypothetical protein